MVQDVKERIASRTYTKKNKKSSTGTTKAGSSSTTFTASSWPKITSHGWSPIAITHANPSFWHPAKRNKSNELLKTLSESKGMLGLSLYPHHLKNNTNCTIENFCEMVARTAEIMDLKNIGIGSDLCLNQPDSIVEWMRNGTWSKSKNYGEGSKNKPGFPKQPEWFKDARGFVNIEKGLKKIGFSDSETHGILGNNWYNFYKFI